MKLVDAEAGGRKSFPSGATRLTSASAAVGLLLLMGSSAKADVTATFHLSGDLNIDFGPGSLVPFYGTIKLDIHNDFVHDTVQSLQITVRGRPVFKQNSSVTLAMSDIGVIGASNPSGDTLSLTFTTPNPGTWNGFDDGSIVNDGSIVGGEVIFGGLTGILLGADGVMTTNHPIVAPSDPPSTPAIPEPSTWTMMLVGLAGLGLAAKRRRALAFLGGRA